ncbi:MAG TPA: redoxin domain-containing protein [Solirubrobacterales bacterium]|nr:redoxin domain-containing protein [Solirubrobacterales bacterium]
MHSLYPLLVALMVNAGEAPAHGHSGAHMVTPPSPAEPEAMIPSLARATTWLNSPPIGAEALRGKVVLIDFWTYTCINWRRTVPWLRAWVQRYGGSGLLLIGVHSPEFAFEHDLDNVRQAVKEMGIGYPVPVDNDFAIWRAFGNEFWPALYIFDSKGRIRHTVFGEDGYEEADQVIRKLLAEAGQTKVDPRPTVVDGKGFEKAADWKDLRSGENYLGLRRTENFASPGGIQPGVARAYTVPPRLDLNSWAVSGTWTISSDRAVVGAAGGRIAYRFHARDVNLVMAPETRGKEIRFRVLLDGKPPGAAHGVDVDQDGQGTLGEQRMYQLIRQPGPIADHLFEIEFLAPGAGAFSFTFG